MLTRSWWGQLTWGVGWLTIAIQGHRFWRCQHPWLACPLVHWILPCSSVEFHQVSAWVLNTHVPFSTCLYYSLQYHLESRSNVQSQSLANAPSKWLISDSCSSVDIIVSWYLICDIHQAQQQITLRCNAGTVLLTQQGYLGGYSTPIWYHPTGVANILSLSSLTSHYCITMDSSINNCLNLHTSNRTFYNFYPPKIRCIPTSIWLAWGCSSHVDLLSTLTRSSYLSLCITCDFSSESTRCQDEQ